MAPSPTFSEVAFACFLAYMLGSIPTAWLVGRSKGIDIFKVGSGQAGATNVWREVSRWHSAIVFFTDWGKGLGAMLVARAIGLHSEFLLIPAFFAVLAHWNCPWTKFRGGDGVSTLTGIGIGFAPHLISVPYALILVITLGWNKRLNHPALWGAAIGYLAIIAMAFVPWTRTSPIELAGFVGLGAAIIVHSIIFRRRRRKKVLLEALAKELAQEVAQDADEILDQPGKTFASEKVTAPDEGEASTVRNSRA